MCPCCENRGEGIGGSEGMEMKREREERAIGRYIMRQWTYVMDRERGGEDKHHRASRGEKRSWSPLERRRVDDSQTARRGQVSTGGKNQIPQAKEEFRRNGIKSSKTRKRKRKKKKKGKTEWTEGYKVQGWIGELGNVPHARPDIHWVCGGGLNCGETSSASVQQASQRRPRPAWRRWNR